MVGGVVVGRILRRASQHVLPGDSGHWQQHQKRSSGDLHFLPFTSILGLCGWCEPFQGSPEECSMACTCGKSIGLELLAAWHRTQSTAVSNLGGTMLPGSSVCLARGPWQDSPATRAWRPTLFTCKT